MANAASTTPTDLAIYWHVFIELTDANPAERGLRVTGDVSARRLKGRGGCSSRRAREGTFQAAASAGRHEAPPWLSRIDTDGCVVARHAGAETLSSVDI